MATQESLAIQGEAAIDRIESRISELIGEEVQPLPRLHRDIYELQRDQLQTIADWLERIELSNDGTLDRARQLAQSSNWTKAEMIDILFGGD